MMTKTKSEKIIDVAIDGNFKISSVRSAHYISSKGTKHFYESLELLSKCLPNEYLKEFLEYKKTNN